MFVYSKKKLINIQIYIFSLNTNRECTCVVFSNSNIIKVFFLTSYYQCCFFLKDLFDCCNLHENSRTLLQQGNTKPYDVDVWNISLPTFLFISVTLCLFVYLSLLILFRFLFLFSFSFVRLLTHLVRCFFTLCIFLSNYALYFSVSVRSFHGCVCVFTNVCLSG